MTFGVVGDGARSDGTIAALGACRAGVQIVKGKNNVAITTNIQDDLGFNHATLMQGIAMMLKSVCIS